ncbi:MAG: HAD superfamily hydrolase (TIGR01490 family) [Oceanicoccus sp.]|jgi:HAD superfamily hydrolase (TIGR01490 family)
MVNIQKAAFFDIDNTVVNIKTMFSFMKYYLDSSGSNNSDLTYESFSLYLDKFSKRTDRVELNKYFYSFFKGWSQETVKKESVKWFQGLVLDKNNNLFIEPIVKLIKDLKQQGFLIVAVSGSFHEALLPLINYLEFDAVLATELKTQKEIYTGSISKSMIGAGKGESIIDFARLHNIKLHESCACGDHITDLSMLELVDRPLVVAGDENLEKIAKERSWEIIHNTSVLTDDKELHV